MRPILPDLSYSLYDSLSFPYYPAYTLETWYKLGQQCPRIQVTHAVSSLWTRSQKTYLRKKRHNIRLTSENENRCGQKGESEEEKRESNNVLAFLKYECTPNNHNHYQM